MLFSFIVPVYNVGKWLVPCLESIRLQTNNDWECLLIDDGSTDGSEKVCDEYTIKDKRFKVIHQVNQGVSAARNVGMAAAQGEWIWCVDSDDVIPPDACEVYAYAISRDLDTDVFYHDFFKGKSICFSNIDKKVISVEYSNDYPEMSAWRCIFRRKFIGEVFFQPYIVGEDLLFCIELFMRADKVGHLPCVLYGYIDREGSIMHKMLPRVPQDGVLWTSRALVLYANDKKGHYSHLYKHRWVQFMFMLPSQICQLEKNDREILSDLWLGKLKEISHLTLPIGLSLYRYAVLRVGVLHRILTNLMVILSGWIFNAFVFL